MARKRKASNASKGADRAVATNRKARHRYEILETFETGIALKGPERIGTRVFSRMGGEGADGEGPDAAQHDYDDR